MDDYGLESCEKCTEGYTACGKIKDTLLPLCLKKAVHGRWDKDWPFNKQWIYNTRACKENDQCGEVTSPNKDYHYDNWGVKHHDFGNEDNNPSLTYDIGYKYEWSEEHCKLACNPDDNSSRYDTISLEENNKHYNKFNGKYYFKDDSGAFHVPYSIDWWCKGKFSFNKSSCEPKNTCYQHLFSEAPLPFDAKFTYYYECFEPNSKAPCSK